MQKLYFTNVKMLLPTRNFTGKIPVIPPKVLDTVLSPRWWLTEAQRESTVGAGTSNALAGLGNATVWGFVL